MRGSTTGSARRLRQLSLLGDGVARQGARRLRAVGGVVVTTDTLAAFVIVCSVLIVTIMLMRGPR
jgi:hypothetical protein